MLLLAPTYCVQLAGALHEPTVVRAVENQKLLDTVHTCFAFAWRNRNACAQRSQGSSFPTTPIVELLTFGIDHSPTRLGWVNAPG